jgi:hypothetical protein
MVPGLENRLMSSSEEDVVFTAELASIHPPVLGMIV